ncbi:hypothetical protein ACQR16_32235 [Bradyrhizobium oligotrophicum]|uniref:hypothetical protein n=1 Tax=Bradyrhizobium oligotrophicum TaxID=44255 RepID=UPI003EBD5FF9
MVRGYILLSVVVALGVPSFAAAQTMSFGESAGTIAASCGADITANCRGVNLDSNRLKECLSRNQDVVSAPCKATYFKAFEAIQKRIAARVTVANACQREIVKLCGGSTKETSKSIPCLVTANGVNARCQQALGEAGYR